MSDPPDPASPVIDTERPEQRAEVEEVHRLAFGGPLEALVVSRIRESPHFIPTWSLVAQQAGRVVGHVLFSRVQLRDTEDCLHPAVLLAPLAVHPRWKGRGVGSALVRAGLARLREWGEPLVLVRGHPEYYRRFGFGPAEQAGVSPPIPLPPQEYSALQLSPEPFPTSSIVYPPAFEVLSYPTEQGAED